MFATKNTVIVPDIHGKQDANNNVNLGGVPNLELESGTTGAPGHIVQQDGDKFDLQFGRMALGSSTTFPPGHILQVQYAELLYPVGTTSTSDAETGLECSITPTSATNYIFAEFHASAGNAQSTYAVRFNLKVEGGGTEGTIGKGTGGPGGLNNRTNAFKCIAGGPLPNGAHGTNRFSAKVRFRCNDTVPNWSSGALTVKLMFSTNSSSYQARLNFSDGSDNTTYSATSSQLILTEVKG